MTQAGDLVVLAMGTLWAGFLVFLRVGAAFAALPGLGEQWLSVRVRLIGALMMTVAILPAALPRIPLPDATLPALVLALGTETVAGLFLGLVVRLMMMAIQTAGTIAAQSTSLSQLLGNQAVEPLPAIGHVLGISALALLMATGFHVKAAALLILSYDLMPALSFPAPGDIADAGRAQVMRSFSLAFTLAAPFVVLSMLYNLTLGVINKAMPQLMVAFVGAPVITLGSIVLLFLASPLMLTVWLGAMEGFLANPFR